MKSGMIIAAAGTIMAVSTIANKSLRRGKRRRAKAKPAIMPSTVFVTTDPPAKIRLLMKSGFQAQTAGFFDPLALGGVCT